MKKSEFKSFLREEIKRKLSEDRPLFPKGGSIGGQHKQFIKDKDFKSTQPSGITRNQHNINTERYYKAMGRLFGGDWSINPNPNIPIDWFLERMESAIKKLERQKRKLSSKQLPIRIRII